jgi:hypothetical protein
LFLVIEPVLVFELGLVLGLELFLEFVLGSELDYELAGLYLGHIIN